jgi:hypothetical protein
MEDTVVVAVAMAVADEVADSDVDKEMDARSTNSHTANGQSYHRSMWKKKAR